MHLLVIVGLALLMFGPKKLPELGKGIGDGIRGFKSAINGNGEIPDQTPPAGETRLSKAGMSRLRPERSEGSQTKMTGASELLSLSAWDMWFSGPKRMHVIVQHIARAKAEFEKTRQEIKSQLDAGLDTKRRKTLELDVP